MMLNYDYPMYRPPSEAKSLIFQVTLGCSFNECSFCDMYRSKEYSERPWDDVKIEIDMMAKQMPDSPRIFLADGDALNLSAEYMIKIVKYLYDALIPHLRQACNRCILNCICRLRKPASNLSFFYICRTSTKSPFFNVSVPIGNDINPSADDSA